jgi:cell division transport system permease protein
MKRYDFGYFLSEGVKNIFLHGFMSFAAVSVIVACLIIIGSFMLLSLNVSTVIREAEESNEIIAFIDETLSEAEAKSVGSKINRIDNVANSVFVSSEEAFEDYSERLGEYKNLLEGLDGRTLLRHRYRIFLEDIDRIRTTVEAIRKVPGVADVNVSYEISQGIMNMRNIVNAVSYILSALLIGVSVFIIANTVKLTTFDRREEIAIMKMVGATNAFIRWPFVFEGSLLGITGGALAFIGQWLIYRYAIIKITESFQIIQLVDFNSVSVPMLLLFLVIGFSVGAGGSVLTIRKFMRV